MNNKLKRTVLVILMIIIFCLPINASVYHYNDYYYLYNPLLSNGIGYVEFHIDQQFINNYLYSPYVNTMVNAVKSWNGNEIYLTRTETYMDSVCDLRRIDSDVYPGHEKYAKLGGWVVVWVGDGPGASNNVSYDNSDYIPDDYWAAEVFINMHYASEVSSITAHEVGHVLGLGHSSIPNSIMTERDNGRTATLPTANNKEQVIDIYVFRDMVWGS